KALTGMSATHFIRHIRLTKAREFLKSGDMNITEIAYQVGFSDPNYFTRCYGEEFGESPSETRNNKKIS
ncbi:MAG TPA: helix-turn-helix transcriptional regulator, partial [Saprospiraceae bacterium]